jgi:hypothetical protein
VSSCQCKLVSFCLCENTSPIPTRALHFTRLERKHSLIVRQEEEDFDEVEYQLLMAENEFNENLLMACSDLHCQLIKTLPEAYMACLTTLSVQNRVLLSLIEQMAAKPITNTDLQIAVCMMDDVVEFGGPSSTQMYQK